jgi:hypothetical protein
MIKTKMLKERVARRTQAMASAYNTSFSTVTSCQEVCPKSTLRF